MKSNKQKSNKEVEGLELDVNDEYEDNPLAKSDCSEVKPIYRYQRYKDLLGEIRDSLEETDLAGEPCCLGIEGEKGAGKTTLAKDYISLYPRIETECGTEIPVLYVETPSPVTVGGMASHLLKVLGDPAWDKGTLPQMNSRLCDLIKDCKVKLIVLDDFHHLIDSETQHVLNKVADWLKVLIKNTNVPFLMISITGKIELILEENAQLSRLFQTPLHLEPFTWDTKKTETIKEFSDFLGFVEQARLPLSKDLPRSEIIRRIYYATRGIVANIMNLFNRATVIANHHDRQDIELEDLKVACQKRLYRHAKLRANPFDIDADITFLPPDPPYLQYVWKKKEEK